MNQLMKTMLATIPFVMVSLVASSAMAAPSTEAVSATPVMQVSATDIMAKMSVDECKTAGVTSDLTITSSDVLATNEECCKCGDPEGGPGCIAEKAPCECGTKSDGTCYCRGGVSEMMAGRAEDLQALLEHITVSTAPA